MPSRNRWGCCIVAEPEPEQEERATGMSFRRGEIGGGRGVGRGREQLKRDQRNTRCGREEGATGMDIFSVWLYPPRSRALFGRRGFQRTFERRFPLIGNTRADGGLC